MLFRFKLGYARLKRINSTAFIKTLCFILLLCTSSEALYADKATLGQPEKIVTGEPNAKPKNNLITEVNSAPKVVAPNIDLKEVAPPPEALLETHLLTKKLESNPSDVLPLEVERTKPKHSSAESAKEFGTHTKSDFDTSGTQAHDLGSEMMTSTSSDEISGPASFVILGAEVPPGTSTRLGWAPGLAIAGLATPVPVLVVNGDQAGKTFCLMAAIHGDELNGIEVVRRVIYDIDPKKLKGRIIGVPIVNLQGFQRNSRYLADRRDLNRYFPGTPQGSLASRIAHSLFNEVIKHCDALIDLHTGSLRRINLPQLRADMDNPQAVQFTEYFDDTVVVHSPGKEGMLRWAAAEQNIPAVTLEIGESNRLQEEQVEFGVKSINGLLDRMGMYERLFTWGDPEPVYYQSTWVRAEQGGILFSVIELGDTVEKGEVLGNVTDPITNEVSSISSPEKGRIIGMTVNQVVMPGFAAYHLGIEASEEEVAIGAHLQKKDADIPIP